MLAGWKRAVVKIAASVLILVNAVSMVFAILMFGISICLIASPATAILSVQTYGTATMKVLLTEDSLNLSLAIGLAVASVFLFFISFMGFYGAISCSQFLLFMYSTLVLLLLLLECALLFYFSSDIVQKGLNQQDGQWVHVFRLAFNCCEHNKTSHNMSSVDLPWSCCGVEGHPNNCTTSKTFANDCQIMFREWLDEYETPVYVGLTVLHVVLSSCSLLRRSCSASRLPI